MSKLELLLLGTGDSKQCPVLSCIMPDDISCMGCKSTQDPEDKLGAGGLLNKRGCPSGLVIKTNEAGEQTTILLDCGPSIRQSILTLFKENGIKRLDGILLTHDHVDAVGGLTMLDRLSDLPAQKGFIDVYCDSQTLDTIRRQFPWLVDASKAKGSGHVGRFHWHVIEMHKEIEIAGIHIVPIPVEHGTEKISQVSLEIELEAVDDDEAFDMEYKVVNGKKRKYSEAAPNLYKPETRKGQTATSGGLGSDIVPYNCTAFIIDRSIVWMTDVQKIPDSTWNTLVRYAPRNSSPQYSDPEIDMNEGRKFSYVCVQYPLLILDCSGEENPKSHLTWAESVACAMRFKAERTYLIGIGHLLTHADLLVMCEEIDGTRKVGDKDKVIADCEVYMESRKKGLWKATKEEKLWMRPSYDGLRLAV